MPVPSCEVAVGRAAVSLAFCFALAVSAACAAGTSGSVGTAAPTPAGTSHHVPATPSTGTTSSAPAVDPADVHANELGAVPVLMYHRIVERPDSVYGQTPAQLRSELERLARAGYVPITAAAYVTGDIDIPAGKHPVVLTFDDSTHDQLDFGSSGEPKSGTAVGVLLSVAEEYPEFRPVATFFVNSAPFALPQDGKRGLTWLRSHGFDIGNHTYTHANLGELSATGVQRELAKLRRMVDGAAPEAEVTTMALPLGVYPDRRELAAKGSWDGVSYQHRGVFLVGARPAPSPYAGDFDPLAIPRIRSQGSSGTGARYASTRWLDYLDKHPGKRYTSDGTPERISFPERHADRLADGLHRQANPY